MERDRPDTEQLRRIGLARFNELNQIMTGAEVGTFSEQFSKLSWIELEESIDVPIDQPEAFSKILLEFSLIIRTLVQRRGFGILGYI